MTDDELNRALSDSIAEPIHSVNVTAGTQYIFATTTDGIVVGSFIKRRRDGGLLFRDVARLAVNVVCIGDRELIYPSDLLEFDEWRHPTLPLLPYQQLTELEPQRPTRLIFANDQRCRKDGTP